MKRFRPNTLLFLISVIPGLLLASFLLFLGAVHLVSPQVPGRAMAENILVGLLLILTGAISIYAVFRPSSGGLFLLLCAFPCGFIFNAFHISHLLYPSREVGYHPFWSALICLIVLLGLLSVIRGRIRRRAASEAPAPRP